VDLGCGEGLNTIILAGLGANVFSIDCSQKNLAATCRRAHANGVRENVTLLKSDRTTLPFGDNQADHVLCSSICQYTDPVATARQIRRLLRPGGQVMITTPARLRFLTRPDPHYQVRGLMFLPDRMQRRVIVDKLKLTKTYDVEHIFWTAGGVIRLFPHRGRVETLVAIPWPGRPRSLREVLWKLFRRLLWDRIVIYKR